MRIMKRSESLLAELDREYFSEKKESLSEARPPEEVTGCGSAIEPQDAPEPVENRSSWSTLQWAREYVFTKGYSVIPLEPGSVDPLIPWEEFQERRPIDAELVAWFGNTDNNIGIVTGPISGIAVVGLEGIEDVQFAYANNFRSELTVQAGTEFNLYFPYMDGKGNIPIRDDMSCTDLRIEGDYVVAPPSIYVSCVEYKWN